jgi:hypothetical protein
MTPFAPKQRNAGEPARWSEVYGRTLGELAQDWRKAIAATP